MIQFTKSSNKIMKEIINKCDLDTYGVYMVILSHRNTETNKCFPGASELVKECKISRITLFKKLKMLEENGYLSINSGKQGVCNNYYFPKEEFYNDNKDDVDQMLATRKKKVFKKKKKDEE